MLTKKDIRKPRRYLRMYRKKRELRSNEVAYLGKGWKNNGITRWERGYHLPTLETALQLSAAIKCPVEVLFFDLFEPIRYEVEERRKTLVSRAERKIIKEKERAERRKRLGPPIYFGW